MSSEVRDAFVQRVPVSRRRYLKARYFLDRIIAVVLVAAVLPFILPVVALVWLEDRHSPIFYHERLGRWGEPFALLKIRTMIPNADQYLDEDGSPTRDRLTSVGRWLRRLSVDELPQLLHVAGGRMSFVGPRPVLPSHWDRYSAEQRMRFCLKPGLTGLAQVAGRNAVPWSRRLQLDLVYLDHVSPQLDMQILFRTVLLLLRPSNVAEDRNPNEVDDLPPASCSDGSIRREENGE